MSGLPGSPYSDHRNVSCPCQQVTPAQLQALPAPSILAQVCTSVRITLPHALVPPGHDPGHSHGHALVPGSPTHTSLGLGMAIPSSVPLHTCAQVLGPSHTYAQVLAPLHTYAFTCAWSPANGAISWGLLLRWGAGVGGCHQGLSHDMRGRAVR